jgi:hypothetical protein
MKENPKAFIPAWLNNLQLSQAEFRVYCCLAARADIRTGIAWPQAETIAKDCMMARRTVWKSLRSLEEKKLIRKTGKPFGASNRYQALVPPIGANEAPIEDIPIGANEAPIEDIPIGANEAPPIGSPFASSIGANEAPGKTTNKGNQGKKTKKSVPLEPSSDGIRLSILFKSSLPTDTDLVSNWKTAWPKIFDQLIAKGRNPDEIDKLIRWLKDESNWWNPKFMEPTKLGKRDCNKVVWYDRLKTEMKSAKSSTSPARHSLPDTSNRPGTYEEA